MGKPHGPSILRAPDNSVWSILYSRLSSDDFEVVAVAPGAVFLVDSRDGNKPNVTLMDVLPIIFVIVARRGPDSRRPSLKVGRYAAEGVFELFKNLVANV
jgi:hypothetical protein